MELFWTCMLIQGALIKGCSKRSPASKTSILLLYVRLNSYVDRINGGHFIDKLLVWNYKWCEYLIFIWREFINLYIWDNCNVEDDDMAQGYGWC